MFPKFDIEMTKQATLGSIAHHVQDDALNTVTIKQSIHVIKIIDVLLSYSRESVKITKFLQDKALRVKV